MRNTIIAAVLALVVMPRAGADVIVVVNQHVDHTAAPDRPGAVESPPAVAAPAVRGSDRL
jgi:hypothetical protein